MVRTVGAEERIFEACENAGTPAPIIDYKPNDLWLEFPFSPEYLKPCEPRYAARLNDPDLSNFQP